MKRGHRVTLTVAGIIILIPVVFILTVQAGFFGRLPGKRQLLNYKNVTASVVLSAEGEMIGKFYSENRTAIEYDRIPAHVTEALVATEDVRFHEHSGIDTRSLFRVIFKTILFRDRSAGGGSTITQQLAKNMYGRKDYALLPLFLNKTREALLARLRGQRRR